MKDGYTMRRRQWLRQLSRRYSKNQHGIDCEEITYYVSERIALAICAGLIVLVVIDCLN